MVTLRLRCRVFSNNVAAEQLASSGTDDDVANEMRAQTASQEVGVGDTPRKL